MNGIIIGLDLDGVSVEYVEGLRADIAEALNIAPEDVMKELPAPTDYGFSNWRIIGDRFKEFHANAVARGLYAKLKPFDGVSDVLWRLSDEGHHVRVITSRFVKHGQNALVISSTAESLDKNNIPYRDIMFVRNKNDVFADVYIDDAPHNIEAFQSDGRDVIIFDAPYNQHCVGDRAYNWADVERLLRERIALRNVAA